MTSRLRWFILGNLIGLVILLGGIILINRYRAGQELPEAKQVEQARETPKEQTVHEQDGEGVAPKR